MKNDYKGPLDDFARVIPVPVVLHEKDVKTLPKTVFDHTDSLGSPRLVEYWEQDPCPIARPMDEDRAMAAPTSVARSAGAGMAEAKKASVKIEAKFDIAEYKILI